MSEAEPLSAFIGEIYDAAPNESLWGTVLAKAAQFVGGASGSIYAKDATPQEREPLLSRRRHRPAVHPSLLRQVREARPVHHAPLLRGGRGTDDPTADIIPYNEFYREWAKPQQLVDHVTAVLDKSTTSVALFGVFRHERDGLADDETKRRMRLIVPHIRRAVLIGSLIDLKSTETAMFVETLDGISAGMFLVDGGAHIVHANRSGHAILANGDFLRAVGGRLSASDPAIEATLGAVFAAASKGVEAVGIGGIAVPLRARGGEHFVAHVLPLTSGARSRTGASFAAVAAVFVHKAALDTPSPPEVIAKAFKLTPTELRVLLAIVEMGGVPEVSEALGVAESTVKTHLRSLFGKTGTSRQADLVKLFAGFSSQLVN
jgi:DNA-binding CsgD family transcriptional regulator